MLTHTPRSMIPRRLAGSHDDRSSSITATEAINGVLYKVVLERDDLGCFREVAYTPLSRPHAASPSAVGGTDGIDASNYLG